MLDNLWNWIFDLPISLAVRESEWLFPALECIHLYSMVCLITLIAMFDVRLMGWPLEPKPLSHFSRLVRCWGWIPFAINVVTGTLLFISKPTEYSSNRAFVWKMTFLFVGVIYHLLLLQRSKQWDTFETPPAAIRVLGIFSLCFWLGILASSRWIAYVV